MSFALHVKDHIHMRLIKQTMSHENNKHQQRN